MYTKHTNFGFKVQNSWGESSWDKISLDTNLKSVKSNISYHTKTKKQHVSISCIPPIVDHNNVKQFVESCLNRIIDLRPTICQIIEFNNNYISITDKELTNPTLTLCQVWFVGMHDISGKEGILLKIDEQYYSGIVELFNSFNSWKTFIPCKIIYWSKINYVLKQ